MKTTIKNRDSGFKRAAACLVLAAISLILLFVYRSQIFSSNIISLYKPKESKQNQETLLANDIQSHASTFADLQTQFQPTIHHNSSETYYMFWRIQKVGSSTLLAILTSFAYRFSMIPRMKLKGNANSFCK